MNTPGGYTGIIPARAGFTPRPARGGRAGRDHPRSRGVYRMGGGALGPAPGSSPLARGLRDRLPPGDDLRGIIPARAGFTYEPDHHYRYDHGSSPLARGLRPARPVGGRGDRIIPARAGFTVSGSEDAAIAFGSSPLARGLRVRRSSRPRRAPDHPRSRGVYKLREDFEGSAFGSSPLARGLQAVLVPELVRARIIPARAGFTRTRRGRTRRPRDHPRSRGVY